VRVENPFAAEVIPVAQTALGYWERALDGEATHDRFLGLADWLVRQAQPGPDGVVWRTALPLPKYEIAEPWPSAMGQGEAISVLLRAHAHAGEQRYADVAVQALGPMAVDVAEGGVARRIDGHLVLEEYPAARPVAILNGWIFALLGVHELATAGGEPAAAALFEESYAGLLALLPRYDTGWWSLYSLYPHARPDLAKPFYQRLHPVMLDALAMVRPDPRLDAMARRWEAQIGPLPMVRVVADKLVFRAQRELQARRGGH